MDDTTPTPEVEPPSFQEVDLSSTVEVTTNAGLDVDLVPPFEDFSAPSPLLPDDLNLKGCAHDTEATTLMKNEVPVSHEVAIPASNNVDVASLHEEKDPTMHESEEIPSYEIEDHSANESAKLSHEAEESLTPLEDSKFLPSCEVTEPTLNESEELPSSHEVAMPVSSDSCTQDSDLPSSSPVAFERSESIKENPFNRLKSKSDENTNDETDQISEKVPKIEDVEVSKPHEKAEEQKSPMVVSVGTIEVNGSNQYEDINIMSKGSSKNEKEPKTIENEESEENPKDYESLRDLRFSSISIYDKPHFEEDIIITVDDAQKHAAESFVSYKVVTKTTRESFLQHEFHVRRRYQDFLWLSNILIQQYPSNIIPPLPQKKIFNKYDPNFLRLRQLALNKFLCRIAEHPILSASEHFFTFLSAKQVELIEQKKTTALKKFTIPQLPITNIESPFTTTSEYIEEFGKILSTLSTQSSKLDKEQGELENALNALSPSLALWANSEVCSIMACIW